jgi:hypothetical protein
MEWSVLTPLFLPSNQEVDVERLVRIWTNRYPWRYRQGVDFVILEDPDGNLFCVILVKG